MSAGTVSLILNILLLVFVLVGFLMGLWRGMKKSGVRTLWLVGFLVLVFLLSPVITGAVMNIEIGALGSSLAGYFEEQLASSPEIANLIATNAAFGELVDKLPAMLVNLVVVVVLVLLASIISLICYFITKLIFFKKSKETGEKVYTVKDGRPVVLNKTTTIGPKKHRLVGGLIGAVGGFVLCFCLMLPITGTVRTVMEYIDTTPAASAQVIEVGGEEEDKAQTNQFEYAEVSKMLKETLGAEAIEILNAINGSILVKVSSVANLDLAIYDSISTMTISGQKVSLRHEVHAVATVAETALYVDSLTDENGNLNWQDINFDKITKAVDAVFSSTLVKTLGISEVQSLLNQATTGTLLQDMVTRGEIDQQTADYLKILLTEIKASVDAYGGNLINYLKADFEAILKAGQALIESGALQIIVDADSEKEPPLDPPAQEPAPPAQEPAPQPDTSKEFETAKILKEVALCLNGTHATSKEANHDYFHDIISSIISSPSLKAGLVGAVNVGMAELKTFLTEELTRAEVDLSGANAVVFDTLTQTAMDWTAFTTSFETMAKTVFDAMILVTSHMDADGNLKSSALLGDEALTGIIDKIAKAEDSVLSSPLFTNTVGSSNLFHQALTQLNRLPEANKYADLSKLTTLSWEDEFVPIIDILETIRPAFVAITENKFGEFRFSSLDFDTLIEEQVVQTFLNGSLSSALKTAEFKAMLLNAATTQVEEDIVLALFENTTTFKDFGADAEAVFEGFCHLAKAGVLDVLTRTDLTETDVNNMASALLSAISEEENAPIRLSVALENVFSSNRLAKIYILGINDLLANDPYISTLKLGSLEVQDLSAWQSEGASALEGALTNILTAWQSLNVTDFDVFRETKTWMPLIFGQTAVGEEGNAALLGGALDALTNGAFLQTSADKNIVRELLFDALNNNEQLKQFINVDLILITTNQTFWAGEFENISETLSTLATTWTDKHQTKTLLEVLLNDGAKKLTKEPAFMALGSEKISSMTEALCQSELFHPAAIELLKALEKEVGAMFVQNYQGAITGAENLALEAQQIASIISAMLEISNIDLSSYDDFETALLKNADLQIALKNLLIALGANANSDGIFTTLFNGVYGTIEKSVGAVSTGIIQMVEPSYSTPFTLAFDDFIAEYDQILAVMTNAENVASLSLSVDEMLKNQTALEKFKALLEALNACPSFEVASGKLLDYIETTARTADNLIAQFVGASFESTIALTPEQTIQNLSGIANVLGALKDVEDLNRTTLEGLMGASGGEVALKALLNTLQTDATGLFANSYGEVFNYVQTTYGALVSSLDGANSQTVVWENVLAEISALSA